MRHRKKSEKFSRPRAQRKALIKSLLRSIIIYEKIKTTTSYAKAIRSTMDKFISLAKQASLSARRKAYETLGDHKLVKKLFNEIAPRFKDLSSGYTRIIHSGYRKGDGAGMSIVELVRIKEKHKLKKSKAKAVVKEKEKVKIAEEIVEQKESKKGFISSMRNIFNQGKNANDH